MWNLSNEEGNLAERKEELTALAEELFKKIIALPKEVRGDMKERTGICVLFWVPRSRNLMIIEIGKPSEAARFFAIEKAVRMDEN